MKKIHQLNSFKRDFKRVIKRNKDLKKFDQLLEKLVNGIDLPPKHHPHKLIGDYFPKWECHIEPDWLLIYEIRDDVVILYRTGTHADLF